MLSWVVAGVGEITCYSITSHKYNSIERYACSSSAPKPLESGFSVSVTGHPGVTESVTVPAPLSTTSAGPARVPFGVRVVACSSFPCHSTGKPHVRDTAGFGGPTLEGHVGMLMPGTEW